MKVCHLTSAHPQEDIRIFHKECASLAAHGYDTYQIACGETYEKLGVHQIGIGDKDVGKLGRIIKTTRRIYKKALILNAEVYHFHDPELMPYALKLKRHGKKVVFDSHEDVPDQIMDKIWIAKPLRKIVSSLYKRYESYVVNKLDAVIAATPHIAKRFEGRANKVVTVNNYPKLDDIVFQTTPFSDRESIACYAGGISENRGENIMKNAMKSVNGELIIAGNHPIEKTGNVSYIGHLDRDGVNELYGKAVVGLCILKPIKNYLFSQPIKMYEYMAAGIPFVCSDFPEWRKVVAESRGGICVDPMDNDAIALAINELFLDRKKAQEMGRNGRNYVIANCTWANEEKALIELYQSI